jgi:hypothetical protein
VKSYSFLFQLAMAMRVFIIDFNAFSKPRSAALSSVSVTAAATKDFLRSLFSSAEVIKVGWAFNNCDIDMLRKASNGTNFTNFYSESSVAMSRPIR